MAAHASQTTADILVLRIELGRLWRHRRHAEEEIDLIDDQISEVKKQLIELGETDA